MSTWLVFDCNYMCHRAFYTTGKLTHNDIITGVIYGFLRDVMNLKNELDGDNLVFCFDSKSNLRKEMYPAYKANRNKNLTEEEQLAKAELHRQIKLLRTEYLDYVGFKNIFCKKGYEADDLVASVCFDMKKEDEAIIISDDHDLYQLFRSNVNIYSPKRKRILTRKWFANEWNMHPSRWTEVKALAGCNSDNIAGIKGIGEATAAKWVRGELQTGSKKYESILKGMDILKTNLPLVTLPFKDTPSFELAEDQFKRKRWNKLMDAVGMKTMKRPKPKPKGFGLGGRRYSEG